MSIGILQSALLALGIFASSFSPQAAPATTDLPIPELIQEVSYVVKEGDTLASISEEQYGYQDYWTTIWNDNDWIEDPDQLEPDWEIKLRTTPPLLVESAVPESGSPRFASQRSGFGEAGVGGSGEVNAFEIAESILTPMPTIILQAQPIIQSTAQPAKPVVAAALSGVGASGPLSDTQIQFLGNCESGMTATRNSGNGYYGAFQFSIPTWNSMGTVYARADLAPLDVQRDAVQRLLQRSSIWTQFPGCARKMQAAGLF